MRSSYRRPSPRRDFPIGEQVTMKIRVTRFFSRRDGWAAGVAIDEEGLEIKFAGAVDVELGGEALIEGTWVQDEKWGPQLKVTHSNIALPETAGGLADFLASAPEFKGIGPATARKIAKAVEGRDVSDTIENHPEVFVAAGVDEEVALKLAEVWASNREINEISSALSAYGIKRGAAKKLSERFGRKVVSIVREDPYWLVGKVSGVGFRTVDAFAVQNGIPKNSPTRVRKGLSYTLSEATDREGHTWIDREELIEKAMEILTLDMVGARAFVHAQLQNELDAENPDLVAFGPGERHIASARLIEREAYCIKRLLEMATANGRVSAPQSAAAERESFIEQHAGTGDGKFGSLNEDQARAVVLSLQRRVVVITGGAGTGKTYLINALAAAHENVGRTITIVAPTGKAARRDEEATRRRAYTIHRFLDPMPASRLRRILNEENIEDAESETEEEDSIFVFGRNRARNVEADVVIVDEASMLDVRLAYSLLIALPEHARIILIGDHNQLPPVGPGALLRDLIHLEGFPVVCLKTVMRQGGILKQNVCEVLNGKVWPTCERPDEHKGDFLPWIVNATLDDAKGALPGFVGKAFDSLLTSPKSYVARDGSLCQLDPLADFQVLTCMHKGPIGTIELNRRMQFIRQQKLGVVPEPPRREGDRSRPLAGDKVIQTKNNYEIGVMNGTLGIVLDKDKEVARLAVEKKAKDEAMRALKDKIDALPEGEGRDMRDAYDVSVLISESLDSLLDSYNKAELIVRFETSDSPIAVSKEDSKDVELAYAISIHKSQGSEIPVVMTVCHRAHSIMLHRGILYTALSRASACSILLGDKRGIGTAANKREEDRRRTLLRLPEATMLDAVDTFGVIKVIKPGLQETNGSSGSKPALRLVEEDDSDIEA